MNVIFVVYDIYYIFMDIFVLKKIFERYLNLFCLNLFVENKDDKGVKKWGEYFFV